MPDFLPRRDANFLAYVRNFANQLKAHPDTYLVSPQQAADYSALVDDFARCYMLANTPSTDSSLAISGKRRARERVARSTRLFAVKIRRWDSVGDAARAAIGVDRPARRSRDPQPQTRPLVSVAKIDGFDVTLCFRDPETGRRRMPRQRWSAIIYWFVGKEWPAQAEFWKMGCITRRALRTVELPIEQQPGVPVWIAARWTNGRCEAGPMSQPIAIHAATRRPRHGQDSWGSMVA